jgi:hypothetical protein
MRLWKFPQSITGKLVTALAGSLLAMGPTACTNLGMPGALGIFAVDSQGIPLGLLFNSDTGSDVLGGIRLQDGSAVYVYATRLANGNLEEITGVILRDPDGQEAGIIFQDGRPTRAYSFDGSTLEVLYEEVSTSRLKGRADLYFAEAVEGEQNQTMEFDVDLEEAAAELARRVEELTGLQISNEAPPDSPTQTQRRLAADALPPPVGKDAMNSQFMLLMFAPFYQFAFVTVGFLCIQIMTAMVGVMVSMVAVMMRAMVVAVLSPFIIMGEMMRGAFAYLPMTIDFTLELQGSGVIIPLHPHHH